MPDEKTPAIKVPFIRTRGAKAGSEYIRYFKTKDEADAAIKRMVREMLLHEEAEAMKEL